MALITGFRYRDDRTVSYRTRVECGWTHGTVAGDGKLVQLETYASDGTTAQVIQLDRKMAGELQAILSTVFPDLR